ncbi:MAG: DinB family protein [Thermoanaerobaculia bacterium]|nr:DinB family protein [Thermoanaerobaculia bacterium]
MKTTSTTPETVRSVLSQALSGRGAHVLVRDVVDGLDWELAGRRSDGAPHTVFQIVNHLVYWHDFAIAWIDGSKPSTPDQAAGSWPGAEAPASESEWLALVERFGADLDAFEKRTRELDLLDDRGPKTVLEILQLIASHNSYHSGQIAALRRALGAWPPPGGGATW